MAVLQTTRFNLPLLAVSQAQKEVTHNEALVRIDALLHTMIESVLSVPPTLNESDIGKCWLIGSGAVGEWAGKFVQLAIWVGNDWRFINPIEGMRLRLRDEQSDAVFDGNNWVFAPIIDDPSGGNIIDVEVRQAMTTLLEHLRSTGYVTR
ncbi:DUF2793 domain-containing protein [Sphingorhabdus sp.]|uniref:DUF2793 domain-containing protein n=1 Tax=Sphingorhabdus sp. TaxID=1902408 RepID=UPI00359393DE